MNVILYFLLFVAAFCPGAVAQLPYDHVETHMAGTLSLPLAGETPRAQRPVANESLTFTGTIPAFNPTNADGSRRWLTSVVLVPTLVVSQSSTVTNTSLTNWGWGEWSSGVRVYGRVGSTEPFGGGAAIMGTCSWDHLNVGETKVFQSDPTFSLVLTDWVGPTERQWYGVGTKTVAFSLASMTQSSGFYVGHGQSQSTMDLRLARPGFSWELMVHYYWTEQHPSYWPGFTMPDGSQFPLRFKVRETPWAVTPTWSTRMNVADQPFAMEGRGVSPQRVLKTFVETYETRTVSYGIEHLGQGQATCEGTAVSSTWLDVGDAQRAGLMNSGLIGGGGSMTANLLSYDGTTDWLGASGLLRLPNATASVWGMLTPLYDASIAAPAIVPATYSADLQQSGLFPLSAYPLAWDGSLDVQMTARFVTIEAP